MQCELCGGEIRGAPRTVHIEGAELRVCVPCSKYGTEVQKPRASTGPPPQPPRKMGGPPAPQPVQRRRRDLFDRMEGDLVPEEELRKKLEEVLGISLLESVEKEVKSSKGKGMTTTLGDIISIKK